MLSDQDIIKLYNDKNFSGAFSGINNLQIALKTDLGETVSKQRLYNILKTVPDYVMNLKPATSFSRRPYDVDSYGKLVQIDLAFMKPYNVSHFKSFSPCF